MTLSASIAAGRRLLDAIGDHRIPVGRIRPAPETVVEQGARLEPLERKAAEERRLANLKQNQDESAPSRKVSGSEGDHRDPPAAATGSPCHADGPAGAMGPASGERRTGPHKRSGRRISPRGEARGSPRR